MLQNHLKIALRNLLKHKFFSLLNIAGLAIGMSACLTVILVIRDQLSYDRFHDAGGRIFRINCSDANGTRLASVPHPLGDALDSEHSVGDATTRLVRSIQNADLTTADAGKTLQVNGFFADSKFFEIFNFPLLAGNAADCLDAPNSIVLSEKTATRLFKNENPLGKILTLKKWGEMRVTAVVAPPPGRTLFEFDCLASTASMTAVEAAYPPSEAGERVLGNWENYFMSYVFVRLTKGKTREDLQNALDLIAEKHSSAESGDRRLTYFSQNLWNISPRPERLANDFGSSAPIFFIYALVAFVLILTIFPCLNYANLAISRALSRAREVGVRKAVGAGRGDLRQQFLTEAVLTALLALAAAWLLHLPLNRFLEKYFPVEIHLRATAADWLIFVAFAVAVGLLAGWMPARRLSKIAAVEALRGAAASMVFSRKKFSWRRAMLVGQFSLSLVLLTVVAALWTQMRYMSLADYGFQRENVLNVELQGNEAAVVKTEFLKDARVVAAAATSVSIAGNNLQSIGVKRQPGAEWDNLHCAAVDENYLSTMGLELIAGENFPPTRAGKNPDFLILNETALEHFSLGSPAEAVGKTIWLSDTTPATVRGVIRDFHYQTFESKISAFGLRFGAPDRWLLHVRVAPGDPAQTLAALESIWKYVDGGVHDFKAVFMEDAIQQAMDQVRFVGGLITFFALLSLLLACLGLLGAVTFSVGSKVKEIGIRKVLGASVGQVVFSLSRQFFLLLAVAVVLALPLGWMLSNAFLEIFAYRISVGALILGGSTAVLLLLGVATVVVQAGLAAAANPVKSLRSE